MTTHVQSKIAGVGTWELVPQATAAPAGTGYRVTVPVETELVARLTGTGPQRRHIIVADREPFTIPDVWHGIVRAWWHEPTGHVVLDVRRATPAEAAAA